MTTTHPTLFDLAPLVTPDYNELTLPERYAAFRAANPQVLALVAAVT